METILGHPFPRHRSQLVGVSVRALRTGDRVGYTATMTSRTQKTLHYYHPSQLKRLFGDLAPFPWHGIDVWGYPHRVLVCFGEAEDGRMVCKGLLIDPKQNREISSRLLRDIRMGEVVTFAALAGEFIPVGTVKRSAGFRLRRVRPGPTGYPESFYKRFAQEYEIASRSYRTPILRLMTVFGRSEATIHRYRKRCLELGLLEQQRPTKGKTS
jgi:hypothetical protein